MAELITYESIRSAHRNEKEDKLQKLPDGFFESVRAWLEHKEGLKTGGALIEAQSAKKLMEDLINRRQKKIVIAALHTVRGDVPPRELTESEQKFFDKIVFLLKEYKNSLREQIISADYIAEEKVKEAREALADMPSIMESLSDSTAEIKKDGIAVFEEKSEYESTIEEKPTENALPGKETPIKDPSMKRARILMDLPRFLGTDLKPYGPFKSGDVVDIPEGTVEMLKKRDAAEVVL